MPQVTEDEARVACEAEISASATVTACGATVTLDIEAQTNNCIIDYMVSD